MDVVKGPDNHLEERINQMIQAYEKDLLRRSHVENIPDRRRRKRAGRGYMLPLARVEHGLTLWQRMLPLKPEQSRTPRTTPSTRFCNRAFPPEGEVSKHKGIFDERIPFRRSVRARSFAEHE